MSGGRYRYACHHISALADDLEAEMQRAPPEPLPERRGWAQQKRAPLARVWSRERRAWIEGEEAAAVLRSVDAERAWLVVVLRAVARAAHDVEWVDSGDYGPGDEVEAIRAVRAACSLPVRRGPVGEYLRGRDRR